MSFRTRPRSGASTRSPTRRSHGGQPDPFGSEQENPSSSRRHHRTGGQHTPRQDKARRSTWMHFSGRTEPLALLTTVKSHRPTTNTRHHNPKSTRNGETRSSHTVQVPDRPKNSATSSTHKSPRKNPTSSLLSLFFGPMSTHPAKPIQPVKPVKPVKPIKKVTCISCLSDDIPSTKAAKLKCSHHMCHSCLRRLFTLSLTDPQQHMPPRCCTQDHIPSKIVELLFDRDFKSKWKAKYDEYTTKDRYYCPSQRCGKWIKPANIVRGTNGKPKYGRCSRCMTKVCCLCHGKWHGSKGECPKDEDVQRLEAMAKANGWQRCYNCSSIVELKDGCNHMTCRCKAEFCMKCAAKWKTCDCPWFDHNVPEHEGMLGFDDPAVWYTDSDDEGDDDVDDWFGRFIREPAYRQQEDFAQQYILHQVLRFQDEFHERFMAAPQRPEQARYVRVTARELRR